MSAFATAIDRARAELAANPRLRLGVWAIVAILAGYVAFVVQAARVDAASADFASADSRLVRGRDLLTRQDWAERLATHPQELAGARARANALEKAANWTFEG